ncbi:hypothetical protein CASFOL_014072 [Castilleja foliolosa]|uniref:25S rRNA (uridine-N(3))-methyltransferase BMT5-like domain-containing protein n=1 Tax=Castilleja foliolosa TaxID=1961234 RepID=A0ABD3DMG2_9LAMI
MGILLSVIRYLGSLILDDEEKEKEKPINPVQFFQENNYSGRNNIVENDTTVKSLIVDDEEKEKEKPIFGQSNSDRNNIVECLSGVNDTVKNRAPAKGTTRWITYYSDRHRILLVGEGDFSFSTCLARAFGWAPNMIATSLNPEEFLVKNYENALPNLVELGIRKCKVIHGIDATIMASHKFLGGIKFDRIIFNFPFAGFFSNLSTDAKLRRHRRLVSLFLKNAKQMVSENGEIHISHKTNGVHAEWKLESIASSHGLMLKEAVDFNLHHYPGYNTKRGFGGDDNFNCYPSKTYKFGLK